MTDLTHAPSDTAVLPTEPCAQCGAGLAIDQRWCLHCGARREGLASPFSGAGAALPPPPVAPPVGARPALALARADKGPRWLFAAVAAGVAGMLFALGLVVGLSGRDQRTMVSIPPAAAPVVRVSVPAGGAAAAPAVEAAFASDWPEGRDGWTVQLSSLDNSAGDVAAVDAAKAAATAAGATDVGALNSDDYASLRPSRYLVYSGVFTSKAKAAKALEGLRKEFPKAKVVEVSASGADDEPADTVTKDELDKKDKLTPEEFQKQSKKLPDKLGTEGKAPPKDDKPAGGGSQGTTIG